MSPITQWEFFTDHNSASYSCRAQAIFEGNVGFQVIAENRELSAVRFVVPEQNLGSMNAQHTVSFTLPNAQTLNFRGVVQNKHTVVIKGGAHLTFNSLPEVPLLRIGLDGRNYALLMTGFSEQLQKLKQCSRPASAQESHAGHATAMPLVITEKPAKNTSNLNPRDRQDIESSVTPLPESLRHPQKKETVKPASKPVSVIQSSMPQQNTNAEANMDLKDKKIAYLRKQLERERAEAERVQRQAFEQKNASLEKEHNLKMALAKAEKEKKEALARAENAQIKKTHLAAKVQTPPAAIPSVNIQERYRENIRQVSDLKEEDIELSDIRPSSGEDDILRSEIEVINMPKTKLSRPLPPPPSLMPPMTPEGQGVPNVEDLPKPAALIEKEKAQIAPIQKAALKDQAASNLEPLPVKMIETLDAAVVPKWTAQNGQNLKDVISSWSMSEGVQLIWDIPSSGYSVLKDINLNDTYELAIAELLHQYVEHGHSESRPIGQLFVDPQTKNRVLLIRADESF